LSAILSAYRETLPERIYLKSNVMYTALQNIIEMENLPPNVVEHLLHYVAVVHLSKDSFLVRQGQRCNHVYIIEKGFARIFTEIDGKEITTLFAKENDIITSTYALFTKNSSYENIQLLEDSILLKINYDAFVHLCKEHQDLFQLYRVLMEKHFLSLEDRTLSLQFDSALERYRKLLSRHPFILQRASLGQIASFLGMSPVTLSRMRSKI
jgi:CRP-like cAMP-binding protein